MLPQTIKRHNLIRLAVDEEWKKKPDATAFEVYHAVSLRYGFCERHIENIANYKVNTKKSSHK